MGREKLSPEERLREKAYCRDRASPFTFGCREALVNRWSNFAAPASSELLTQSALALGRTLNLRVRPPGPQHAHLLRRCRYSGIG